MNRLTGGVVLLMRCAVRDGATVAEVATQYDIDYQTASVAINGRTWAHLDEIVPPVRGGTQKSWVKRRDMLTEERVLDARRRARAGEPLVPLADEYQVGRDGLRAAIQGKSWAHLDEIEPPVREISPSVNRGNRRRNF